MILHLLITYSQITSLMSHQSVIILFPRARLWKRDAVLHSIEVGETFLCACSPYIPTNRVSHIKDAVNAHVNIFRVQELSFRDGDKWGEWPNRLRIFSWWQCAETVGRCSVAGKVKADPRNARWWTRRAARPWQTHLITEPQPTTSVSATTLSAVTKSTETNENLFLTHWAVFTAVTCLIAIRRYMVRAPTEVSCSFLQFLQTNTGVLTIF
jgi:hypothetical protein